MVTAYDAPSGRLADEAGVDIILVGDSAAMTVLGHDSTVPATMDEMLVLTRAVTRGARRPLVVARHAVRLVPGLGRGRPRERDPLRQGGRRRRRQARGRRPDALARPRDRRRRHPGDGPRRPDAAVGDRCSAASRRRAGRPRRRAQLVDDALALEEAGCFALVLEAVPAPVAARITRRSTIPTIGIGAGAECDGQVLVWHDLLGLYEGHARRASSSATRTSRPRSATRSRRTPTTCASGAFPEEQHTYAMPDEELALFEESVPAR